VALGSDYFKTESPIHPALMDASIQGQGVYFDGVSSKLVRGIRFEDEFIWGVVDDVLARREKRVEAAPDTPVKRALDIMQARGVDFIRSTELGPELGIEETRPGELGKQLKELLKVGPEATNNGRGYKLATLKQAALSDA
jgi:S-DNA-T family DNA segregation ATPase FtsK/SpoIIIE